MSQKDGSTSHTPGTLYAIEGKKLLKKIKKYLIIIFISIVILITIDIIYELYGWQIKCYKEIQYSREVIEEIINNDNPTDKFINFFDNKTYNKKYINNLFYGIKIWLIENDQCNLNLKKLKVIHASKDNNKNIANIEFSYNNSKSLIYNTIIIKDKIFYTNPWMYLSHDWNPDCNHDETLNFNDIICKKNEVCKK